MSVPLSLYLHVPFCRQRCHYCHFEIKVFHPGSTKKESILENYENAILNEIRTYARAYADRPLQSIYLGGGTPSFLGTEKLEKILSALVTEFKLDRSCEITLEVNPEDVNEKTGADLRNMGVTRLSIGVQSFDQDVLEAVKRPHSAQTALDALDMLGDFKHGRSIDLILGLPLQTKNSVCQDLEILLKMNLQHVSLYLLERDLPVPLDKFKGPIPSEDQQADFYDLVCQLLHSEGFEQYEISNFCLPGYESNHNLNYWRFGDYLGLGPAAHGRVGRIYWQNQPLVSVYTQAVRDEGRGVSQVQHWTPEEWNQQRKIQAMRLNSGLEDRTLSSEERNIFQELKECGLLSFTHGHWALTQRGKLLANDVFAVFV